MVLGHHDLVWSYRGFRYRWKRLFCLGHKPGAAGYCGHLVFTLSGRYHFAGPLLAGREDLATAVDGYRRRTRGCGSYYRMSHVKRKGLRSDI